jgi:hypothetical protein
MMYELFKPPLVLFTECKDIYFSVPSQDAMPVGGR